MLMKLITLLEVEEGVNQMEDGKAPGLDGFTVNLFHHFLDLTKHEVWKIVENSLASWNILPAFNATFLTLIPKSEGVKSLDKFQPITLYNAIYKIVTKVIANILKPI